MTREEKIDRLKKIAESALRCAATERREEKFCLSEGDTRRADMASRSAEGYELNAEACLNEAMRLACEEEK